MLQPIFLFIVDDLKLWVQLAQLRYGTYPRRIVGGDRGAFEALVEDAAADPDALWVVGCVEDATLDLRS